MYETLLLGIHGLKAKALVTGNQKKKSFGFFWTLVSHFGICNWGANSGGRQARLAV